MSLLSVEGLSHSFGDRMLFKNVSLQLNNEHVGLVGANGVGKSTLMNIITGQQIHDTGKVQWALYYSTHFFPYSMSVKN